jgi:hypothetical protein
MELGSLAGKVEKVWGEEGGHIDIVTETKEGRKRGKLSKTLYILTFPSSM